MVMVKNHTILIFLVLACFVNLLVYDSFGTTPYHNTSRSQIDSLLNALPQSDNNDRFDIYIHLSNQYLSYSIDSSKSYANLGLQEAKLLKAPALQAKAFKIIGNVNYYQGNNNLVIAYYDSSSVMYEKVDDKIGLSKVWNNLGIIYQQLGNYKESIDYHMKSLYSKKDLKDSLGVANSLNNIGSVYFDLNDLPKAKEYFDKALQIIEQTGNTESHQSMLNNLGIMSQEAGKYQESLDYFNRSLKIGEANNIRWGLPILIIILERVICCLKNTTLHSTFILNP